jgi:hypothetical protein
MLRESVRNSGEVMMIKRRNVRVFGRDGRAREVPMTAEQAAYFLRLAEFRAKAEPQSTFHSVVEDWIKQRG